MEFVVAVGEEYFHFEEVDDPLSEDVDVASGEPCGSIGLVST